jgi:hypothetical protein
MIHPIPSEKAKNTPPASILGYFKSLGLLSICRWLRVYFKFIYQLPHYWTQQPEAVPYLPGGWSTNQDPVDPD